MLLVAVVTWFVWVSPTTALIGRTPPVSGAANEVMMLWLSEASRVSNISVTFAGEAQAANTKFTFTVGKALDAPNVEIEIFVLNSSRVKVQRCTTERGSASTTVVKFSDLPESQGRWLASANRDRRQPFENKFDTTQDIQTTSLTPMTGAQLIVQCTLSGTWQTTVPGYSSWSVPTLDVVQDGVYKGDEYPYVRLYNRLKFGSYSSLQNSTPPPDTSDSNMATWYDERLPYKESEDPETGSSGGIGAFMGGISVTLLDAQQEQSAQTRVFNGGIALGIFGGLCVWLLVEVFELHQQRTNVAIGALPVTSAASTKVAPSGPFLRGFLWVAVAISVARRALSRR